MDENRIQNIVHIHCPVLRRGFDCNKNKHIWEKLETSYFSPEVTWENWPQCLSHEEDIESNP